MKKTLKFAIFALALPAFPVLAQDTNAAPSSPPMPGMSGAAAPADASANMKPMGDKMEMAGMGGGMGMDKMEMDKMMGMDQMEMDQMGMDKMEMAKMKMDKMKGMGGNSGSMTQPHPAGGAHLYHIGATGFFLDHPDQITLSTEQQAGLSKARDQAVLAKNTADRAVEQAEQELWMLTAADQPNVAKIESKVREIETLGGDERLAFIRSVGAASRLLTDEQRKILTTSAPAAPMNSMPAPASTTAPTPAAPDAPMKDM